jgi:hypothetical protein
VKVLESTDPSFTGAASGALQRMRFRPARVRGRVVRQLVEQVIRFTLGR